MARKNKVLFTLDPIEVAVRRMWKINPATKVVPSKKQYSRKKRHKSMALSFDEVFGEVYGENR